MAWPSAWSMASGLSRSRRSCSWTAPTTAAWLRWWASGQGETSLAEWARFALAYAPLVMLEPLVTLGTLWLLRAEGPLRRLPLAAQCFAPQPGRA